MNYDDTAKFELQGANRQSGNGETLGGADEGTQKSATRTLVRITSHRVRLLDKDNLHYGCKALLDSLRYAGLISGDSEKEIDFKARQIKVGKRTEEKTEVLIEYP